MLIVHGLLSKAVSIRNGPTEEVETEQGGNERLGGHALDLSLRFSNFVR